MKRWICIIFSLICCIIVKGIELEVNVLSTPEELDLSNDKLCVLPGKGLFVISGNTVFSLEGKSEISRIELLDTSEISHFMFLKDRFIYKAKNKICSYMDKAKVEYQFENENFEYYPSREDSLFIVRTEKDTSYVYGLKLGEDALKPILCIPDSIIGVYGSVNNLTLATKSRIYGYTNQKPEILFSTVEDIRSIIFTPFGILFCSPEGLFRVISINQYLALASGGIKQLLYDGEIIYALTDSGYILSLSEATQYIKKPYY